MRAVCYIECLWKLPDFHEKSWSLYIYIFEHPKLSYSYFWIIYLCEYILCISVIIIIFILISIDIFFHCHIFFRMNNECILYYVQINTVLYLCALYLFMKFICGSRSFKYANMLFKQTTVLISWISCLPLEHPSNQTSGIRRKKGKEKNK